MKFCSSCGTQCEDMANNCPKCGAPFGAPVYAAAPAADPYDHTAQFSAQDISENKCYAALCYLFGLMGIIVAAICAKESAFVKFHMTWALRLVIAAGLSSLLTIVPLVGWIAGPVCAIICVVLQIIATFQVFGNKAKEPAIVRGLSFLK